MTKQELKHLIQETIQEMGVKNTSPMEKLDKNFAISAKCYKDIKSGKGTVKEMIQMHQALFYVSVALEDMAYAADYDEAVEYFENGNG